MFYFDFKAEDRSDVDHFRINAHAEGLNFNLSQKAAEVLHILAMTGPILDLELIEVDYYVRPYINTLFRKGLIRKNKQDGWEVSKVGKAVLVVCDAAGLIRSK